MQGVLGDRLFGCFRVLLLKYGHEAIFVLFQYLLFSIHVHGYGNQDENSSPKPLDFRASPPHLEHGALLSTSSEEYGGCIGIDFSYSGGHQVPLEYNLVIYLYQGSIKYFRLYYGSPAGPICRGNLLSQIRFPCLLMQIIWQSWGKKWYSIEMPPPESESCRHLCSYKVLVAISSVDCLRERKKMKHLV